MKNSVLPWLDETAKRLPNKLALQDISGNITYQEYRSKSLAIAYKIVELNKGEMKKPVVVYLEKGKEVLVSFMGVAYSGCFYSPIDTEMPPSRVDKILEVLKPEIVITTNKLKTNFEKFNFYGSYIIYEETICSEEDETAVKPYTEKIVDTDLLYVLFTSGSTGVPKGVIVNHRSTIDFIDCFTETFGITNEDVIGNQAPFDFDVSVKDIYSSLKTGATLQLIPKMCFSFPTKLLDFLDDRKVTTIIWAVSALCIVTTLNGFEYKRPSSLNKIMFSGEVMPIKHLNAWRAQYPDAMFVNLYGPTEITCNCTYYVIDREFDLDEKLPMGKPFANERVFLLDDEDRLVDAGRSGELGEICVSGTAVTLGYLCNPEKTAAAFVQNPLNDRYMETIYRTGDLGYYSEDGELFFSSRKDFQIKHMGHRIELGEIET